MLLEGSKRLVFPLCVPFADALGKAASVRPHDRHLLRVKEDIDIIDDSGHLESTKSWKDIIIRIIIVVVWDQLAVDLLFIPRFGHLVHDAVGIWHVLFNSICHISEVLYVLGLVVPRVPLVRLAIAANFKHKCQAVVLHLLVKD